MKKKSKAQNPFLVKNLIIFLIIKTQMWNVLAYCCLKLHQNPTNSAATDIFRGVNYIAPLDKQSGVMQESSGLNALQKEGFIALQSLSASEDITSCCH